MAAFNWGGIVNQTKYALSTAIILSGLALFIGFILIEATPFAIVAAAIAIVWLVGLQLEWHWVSPLAFVLFWGLIVLGSFVKVGVIWLGIGMVSALAAWQFAQFTLRTANYIASDKLNITAARQLIRVLWVAAASIVLIGFTLGTQFELTFGWAMVLALVAFAGLSRVLSYLRKVGE